MRRRLREGGSALQGHIRRRAPAGSWEYILDVGRYRAERCQDCGRRFWIERRPKETCPACGGELRETEERRRETKGGFASRKDCQAALTRKLTTLAERTESNQHDRPEPDVLMRIDEVKVVEQEDDAKQDRCDPEDEPPA